MSISVVAQSNDEIVFYRTDNSQIPSNKIFSICIDSNNVKWIGTDQGLARFDGINWTIYDTSNGLLSNKVRAVTVDKMNNLWIIDSVLSKYENSKWVHYTPEKFTNASINSPTLAIDENNVKWMTTIGQYGGTDVCCFNDTTFKIFGWANTTDDLRNVWNIKTYKNEKWIADYGTLWKYDDKKIIRVEYDSLTGSVIHSYIDAFSIGKNGRVLLSLHRIFGSIDNSYDSCYVYDIINSSKFYRIEGLPNEFSFGVAYEDEDTKWVACNYNLFKFKNGLQSSFRHGFDLSYIGVIEIDKYGNKWLASQYDWYNSGIMVFREGGVILTSIKDDDKNLSFNYNLSQNYPNPFNPSTTIKYSIPVETMHASSEHVILKVYDLLGREVAVLVNEAKQPSNYEVKFDGTNLPSGVYFYQLTAGDFVQTKKMVLLR
jgi:hypothetical protein